MKVEYVATPGKRGVMTILLDDEPWQNIHLSIFGFSPSLPKDCLSIEEFSEKFCLLEYKQAKQYALKRLSIQCMPSAVLAKALKQRFISNENIERILEEFQNMGFLNDEQWTESFVRGQISKKNGPRKIAMKLARKGILREDIEEGLKIAQSADTQQVAIQKLLKTRYRNKNLTDYAEKRKVVAALVRKGFDLEIIIKTLKKGNNEDWDEFD